MNLPALDRFLSTPEIAAVFTDAALLQAMFGFEAALARAQAAEGLIPAAAATAIAGVCKVELFDTEAIIAASGRAGSLAIPLVEQLRRSVALFDPDAARHVHFGSTSQDVIDTALALCTRQALALLERDLAPLIDTLLALAEAHAHTPVLARTLMQPAQPTSFGLKCVNWAAPLVRSRVRLHAQAQTSLALQLGGAVGTLAVMGAQGDAVARRMAAELGLALPPSAWHTQRDEWLRLGLEVALLTGNLGKIGSDLALMSQAEVAELAEPSAPGRGASSAMPHKRNPVAAMVALAAAQRAPARVATLLAAMGQAHERGLGDWQAEIAEWPGLWISAHGALAALLEAMQGLQVDPVRMLHNLAEFGPLEDPPPPAHLDAAASLARRRIEELRAQNAPAPSPSPSGTGPG